MKTTIDNDRGATDNSKPTGKGPAETEGGHLYARVPRLSDRCGGSCDEPAMVPIPAGMDLPEGVVVVRVDD